MQASEVSAFLLTRTKLGKKIPSELLATAELSDLDGLESIDGVAAQVLYGRGADAAVIAAKRCSDPVWLAKRVRGESRVGVLNALAANPHVPQASLEKLLTKLLKQRYFFGAAFGPVWNRLPVERVVSSYQEIRANRSGYYEDARNLDLAYGIALGRNADEEMLRQILTSTSTSTDTAGDYTVHGIAMVLLEGTRTDLGVDAIVKLLALRGDALIAAFQALVKTKHLTELHARVYESWNLSGRSPLQVFSRNVVYNPESGTKRFTATPEAARLLMASENQLARALASHVSDLPDDVFDQVIEEASTYCLLIQLLATKDPERAKRAIAAMPSNYQFESDMTVNLLSRFELPRPLVYRILDNPRYAAGLLVQGARPAEAVAAERSPRSQAVESKFRTQLGDFQALSDRKPEWLDSFVASLVQQNWEGVPHELVVEVLENLPGVAKYVFDVSAPLSAQVARYLDETFGEDSGSAALFISLAPSWGATFPALLDSVRSLR
jgi:hypothetical protein